jgi:methylated-DNA-[protein]-cysteine S-methyltransferase
MDIAGAARRDYTAEVAAASERAIAAARREGLIDVAYDTIDTPFGPMLVAVTPKGLVRIAFQGEDIDGVLTELAARLSPRVLEEPKSVLGVRRELDAFFEGKLRSFDLPLDWSLSSGFALRVRKATYRIPYGRTASYGEVAAKAGNPRASRAAGNALGSNPIPIVVPCHRVLRTGGALGGYGGGLDMKTALLRLEGAMM